MMKIICFFYIVASVSSLNVLCLHSYAASGKLFKVQMRDLVNECKDFAEFHFPNAPHRIEEMKPGAAYSWWSAQEKVQRGSMEYIGKDVMFDYIKERNSHHGSFDVVLGYSQGACAAIKIITERPDVCDNNLKLIGCMGGFPPRDVTNDSTEFQQLDIPSIHLVGAFDNVVLPLWSMAATKMFKNPEIVVHSGSHDVPRCDLTHDALTKALTRAYESKKETQLVT